MLDSANNLVVLVATAESKLDASHKQMAHKRRFSESTILQFAGIRTSPEISSIRGVSLRKQEGGKWIIGQCMERTVKFNVR